MKWTVPMPATEPRAGHAHVRLGVKRADGGRLEFDGQLPEELAMQVQLWVCRQGQQPAPAEEDDGQIYTIEMPNITALVWYFDLRREFTRAMHYALSQGLTVEVGTVDEMPEGDFITDASEYINWLKEQA